MNTMIEYDDFSTGRLLPVESSNLPNKGDFITVKYPDRDEVFVKGRVIDIVKTIDEKTNQHYARVVVQSQ